MEKRKKTTTTFPPSNPSKGVEGRRKSGSASQRFASLIALSREDLPWGIDVLVTHEAPYGIFDQTGGGNWGSSHDLLAAIWEKKPKVR